MRSSLVPYALLTLVKQGPVPISPGCQDTDPAQRAASQGNLCQRTRVALTTRDLSAHPRRSHHAAHTSDNTSACSNTVFVALSRLSGGYPYFRSIRFTSTLAGC